MRGFTLLEIIIASAIGLILLGVLFAFLVPALRTSTLGQVRIEMEQQAIVAINRIASDVQRTAGEGLSSTTGVAPPVALGMQQVRDVSPEGEQIWETRLVIYNWRFFGGDLLRREVVPLGADRLEENRPRSFSAEDLVRLSLLDGRDKVVARGVTAFNVTRDASRIEQPVSIRIELERRAATGRGQPERFSFVRTVSVRNLVP